MLLLKLFDKLIRLELVEDSQTLSSSTNQLVKQEIKVSLVPHITKINR